VPPVVGLAAPDILLGLPPTEEIPVAILLGVAVSFGRLLAGQVPDGPTAIRGSVTHITASMAATVDHGVGGREDMTRSRVRSSAVPSATELLGELPIFAGLSDAERNRLEGLLLARHYAHGEGILLEGDGGTALCLIAEGQIRIQLTGADGRAVVIAVHRPGEILGELALVDGEPGSADAIAEDPARVFWLRREDFVTFLDGHPRAALTMLASLSRRLRHTTRVVQAATSRDVPSRLAAVLLDLAARRGQAVPEGIRIDALLTQSELAAMVGATRETVNRGLRCFERRGLIGWDANRLVIARPDQLRARADGARPEGATT
jgi:CRP/FNR family cyclic AMP-dependent transcriptional regulator